MVSQNVGMSMHNGFERQTVNDSSKRQERISERRKGGNECPIVIG